MTVSGCGPFSLPPTLKRHLPRCCIVHRFRQMSGSSYSDDGIFSKSSSITEDFFRQFLVKNYSLSLQVDSYIAYSIAVEGPPFPTTPEFQM